MPYRDDADNKLGSGHSSAMSSHLLRGNGISSSLLTITSHLLFSLRIFSKTYRRVSHRKYPQESWPNTVKIMCAFSLVVCPFCPEYLWWSESNPAKRDSGSARGTSSGLHERSARLYPRYRRFRSSEGVIGGRGVVWMREKKCGGEREKTGVTWLNTWTRRRHYCAYLLPVDEKGGLWMNDALYYITGGYGVWLTGRSEFATRHVQWTFINILS